jgi:hypothetical protein
MESGTSRGSSRRQGLLVHRRHESRVPAMERVGEVLVEHLGADLEQEVRSTWVTVLDGEVEITTTTGESISGSSGLLVGFAPNERHAVHARTDTRLLLLRTPWPGTGHPGAMTLDPKSDRPPRRRRAPTDRLSST